MTLGLLNRAVLLGGLGLHMPYLRPGLRWPALLLRWPNLLLPRLLLGWPYLLSPLLLLLLPDLLLLLDLHTALLFLLLADLRRWHWWLRRPGPLQPLMLHLHSL